MKLSFEEHKELGGKIKELRRALVEVKSFLEQRFGLSSSSTKYFENVLKEVEEARNELDNLLGQDHPKDFDAGIYY